MHGERVNAAHPMVARRLGTSRRRVGHRAAVAAFEAWQRRQAAHRGTVPRAQSPEAQSLRP